MSAPEGADEAARKALRHPDDDDPGDTDGDAGGLRVRLRRLLGHRGKDARSCHTGVSLAPTGLMRVWRALIASSSSSMW